MSPTRALLKICGQLIETSLEFLRALIDSIASMGSEGGGNRLDPQLGPALGQFIGSALSSQFWILKHPGHYLAGVLVNLSLYYSGLVNYYLAWYIAIPKAFILFMLGVLLFEMFERQLVKHTRHSDAFPAIQKTLCGFNAALGAAGYTTLASLLIEPLFSGSWLAYALCAIVSGIYNFRITKRRIEFYAQS